MGLKIFKFSYQNGLLLELPENERLIIDSIVSSIPPKVQTIVTHAHSDHFAALNSHSFTYATKETIDLYISQKMSPQGQYQTVNFGEKIDFKTALGPVSVTFIPSGHVLGAASIFIEHDAERLLFSGDIGGKGLLTVGSPLKGTKADILIVEATFGSPDITFPPREEISMNILKWAAEVIKQKEIAVFNAGKIGSAQELIKLFNNFTSIRVLTHGGVTQVSNVYKKYGVKLDFFDSRSEEGRKILREGDAIIIQPRENKIVPFFIKEHLKYKRAIVTGMTLRFPYKDFDAAFPLSSHASYRDILDYVQEVLPEKVYTIFGFEDKLAKAITKELQIPAKSIRKKVTPDLETLLPLEEPSFSSQIDREKDSTESVFSSAQTQERQKISPPKKEEKKNRTLDDFFTKDQ